MLSFLKQKKSVEDVTHELIKQSLPKAFDFYRKENEHSRTQLVLDEKMLREVGAGMCLFYLAVYLPSDKPGNQAKMGRAYTQVKKEFRSITANPQKSYDFWKSCTEGFLLHDKLNHVDIATRLGWERLLPDRKFIDQTPFRSYAYYLQLQVKDVEKLKIT